MTAVAGTYNGETEVVTPPLSQQQRQLSTATATYAQPGRHHDTLVLLPAASLSLIR